MSDIIEKYLEDVRAKSRAYATAKAQFTMLDHYRHVVLADQQQLAELEGAKSVAAQDRDARSSDAYQKHLQALQEAQERAIKLEWELKLAEWQLELYRTQEATRRVEARHYGIS